MELYLSVVDMSSSAPARHTVLRPNHSSRNRILDTLQLSRPMNVRRKT